jgi:hypothetical protein
VANGSDVELVAMALVLVVLVVIAAGATLVVGAGSVLAATGATVTRVGNGPSSTATVPAAACEAAVPLPQDANHRHDVSTHSRRAVIGEQATPPRAVSDRWSP